MRRHSAYTKRIINTLLVLVIGGLTLFPFLTLAKETRVYFVTRLQDIHVGDTFVVDVKISNPDKLVNAAEGYVLFDKNRLEAKEISTGGSIFSLWPQYPKFSNEEGGIRFTGGVPGGFQSEEAEVFKIIFIAKQTGLAKLDFRDDIALYLNDGQGTRIGPWVRPVSISLLERPKETLPQDEWQRIIAGDTTPPEPFEVVLGQSPAIFDNQYFISFFATDGGSGVDRYEIKEGDGDFVRGESPYVLKDQALRNIIRVKAVDKAGNERMGELLPTRPPVPIYKNYLFWVIIILLIIVPYFIRRKPKSKK